MGKVDPKVDVRKFGLELVGNIAWGTHLCEFYETKRDLIDILVPYFVEGLKSNEFCMWVTSPPLEVDEAKKALKKKVPDLDRYVEKGQIEIISYKDWYLLGDKFDADRVLQGWVKKEKNALKKGFEGLRLTGNTFWIERKDWASFTDYEASVNAVIGSHRMIALCTYSLKKCGGTDVVDVMRNHVGTLIRKGEAWNLVEDVARRKRAENGLQHEREFSGLLVNSSVDGILAYDRDFRFTVWNEMMERISGLSREQVVGKSALEAFPILKQTGDDKFMREALAGKTGVARDLRYKVPDTGREGCFEGYYSPILSRSGEVLGGLGIVHDVTEQRKTEEALKISEKKYRDLVANLAEGILVIDKSGKISYVNPQMAKMLGYSEAEMIGRLLFDFMDERGKTDARAAKWLRRQGTSVQIEQEFIKKDGSRLMALVTTSPITEHDRSVGVIAGVIDITERKETEEHIRALSAFPAENPNPVIRVSKDGKILFANSASLLLLAEWNCQVGQLMLGEWCQRVKEAYASTSKKELENAVADRTFSFLIIPIKDAGYVNIYGRDITDQKKAETAIHQSEEKYRSIVETAQEGIMVANPDGRIVFANERMAQTLGYTVDELAGKPGLEFVPEKEKARAHERMKNRQEDIKEQYEVWMLRKDGSEVCLLVSGTPLFDKEGKHLGNLGMYTDITERKKAEEALQKSEELSRRQFEEIESYYDNAPVGLAVLDTDLRYVRINKRLAEIHGRSADEHISKTMREIVPALADQAEKLAHTVIETGEAVRNIELTGETSAQPGVKRIWLESWIPVKSDNGNVCGVNVVVEEITERKKAEETIRESEQRMNRSQEMAHLGSWELDLLNDRLTWSDEVYRIFGLKPQEFASTYEAFLKAVHPEDRALVDAAYSDSLRDGTNSYEIEHRVVRPNGEVRIVHEKCEHVRDSSGRIIRSVGMIHDITERKKMEETIQQAARDWEETFDSVPDLIAILDNQHRIVRANQAMAQQLRLTPAQCIGLPCYESVHGTCQPPDFCPHAKTLRDGQEHTEELHEDRLGGDFLVSTTPVKDERGQMIGSVHVARNITERKKIENQLREARDYLDSLLNYANAPIIVWDPEFRITMFNRAFERLTGLSSSEAIGKPLDILFPKEQKGEAMSHIQRTLAGEQWETVEIPILHKEGIARTLLWNSANIHDPVSRKVIATIAQGQDITERKSLEAKLEQYTKHLEHLVDEKTRQLQDSERLATIGQTAGMVGHDIRNPLQSIEGAVYLAKDEVKSMPVKNEEKAELEGILQIIENQTEYIDHIVADLQDFARVAASQPLETDVQDLIINTIPQKTPSNIEVCTVFQENLKKIIIDPVFMKRVMRNLIDNAIQAMPKGGKLNITVAGNGDKVEVRVEDTGQGIPESDKSRIFTPLFTTKAKGQGFGLAVCKKLVEAQEGKIMFTSEVGKGTSFTIILPNRKVN